MKYWMITALLLGIFALGFFVGYTGGIMATWKTDRYYTVSGWVRDALTSEPKANVYLTLWYNNDPLGSVYTDEYGFYAHSFLGFVGAKLVIIASHFYVYPAWTEYILGDENHIRQNFEVW